MEKNTRVHLSKIVSLGEIDRTNSSDFSHLEAEGYVIDPPEFAKLSGWNHIMLQLNVAMKCLIKLRDSPPSFDENQEESHFEHHAMFTAFLVIYARCFVTSEGRLVQLSGKEVFKDDPIGLQVHDEIIAMRHTFAAHSMDSSLLTSVMAVRDHGNQIELMSVTSFFIPTHQLQNFYTATCRVKEYVINRVSKHIEKISAKIGKPINIGEFSI